MTRIKTPPAPSSFALPPPSSYIYDLGTYTLPIATKSPSAQTWFDRGLIWCYAFHHEEAERCFRYAIHYDPSCAMAYWGMAYALGPNYNRSPRNVPLTFTNCRAALAEATRLAERPIEVALIRALYRRFPEDYEGGHENWGVWNKAYMLAMEEVYTDFSEHLDVAGLFADSMMALAPWKLWDIHTGKPNEISRTAEARAVLERALKDERSRQHPFILHLYIHLMELSPFPELALVPADSLRGLVPAGGHLNHMPAHLDLLIGDYRRAIASNMDAIQSDEKYMLHGSRTDFYTFYRLHDYTFPIYAAMFNGQYKVAMSICDRMDLSLTDEAMRTGDPPMVDWLEGFLEYRPHILIRFGKWQEVLLLEFPQDRAFYCVYTTTLHYARGVAYAVLGDTDAALQEQQLFRTARTRVPPSRLAFPNIYTDVFDVAEAMLSGEIAYRLDQFETAWEQLELAIYRSDHLVYAEPWAWLQPPRHAYGALLLEQGHAEKAAKVFAEDLGYDTSLPRAVRHPNNVWALKGYHDCLIKLGRVKEAEIVEPQLVLALAVADVKVERSCLCAKKACCLG